MTFPTRIVALLAGGAVALGAASCSNRNENTSGEGSESDEPTSTVRTITNGLGPSNTTPEKPTTQEQQPLTETTP
ncbi:MAG TPA: hypothetical protein VIL49_02515 [Capillimicrobium sp.]|jgi:hypothetical protein